MYLKKLKTVDHNPNPNRATQAGFDNPYVVNVIGYCEKELFTTNKGTQTRAITYSLCEKHDYQAEFLL